MTRSIHRINTLGIKFVNLQIQKPAWHDAIGFRSQLSTAGDVSKHDTQTAWRHEEHITGLQLRNPPDPPAAACNAAKLTISRHKALNPEKQNKMQSAHPSIIEHHAFPGHFNISCKQSLMKGKAAAVTLCCGQSGRSAPQSLSPLATSLSHDWKPCAAAAESAHLRSSSSLTLPSSYAA